jgi:hypothetical protein
VAGPVGVLVRLELGLAPALAAAGSGWAGSLARLGLAPAGAGLQKLNTTRKTNNNERMRVTTRDSARQKIGA